MGFRWSMSLKPIRWYPSKRGFHKWGYPKIDDFEWTILFKWRIWEYCPFQKPPYYNIRHLTLMPQPPARRIFLDRLTSCKIRSFLWHERSFGREPWSSTLNPLSNEKRCAMFSGLFLGYPLVPGKSCKIEMWIFHCGVRFPAYVVLPGTFEITVAISPIREKHSWCFDPTQILEANLLFAIQILSLWHPSLYHHWEDDSARVSGEPLTVSCHATCVAISHTGCRVHIRAPAPVSCSPEDH